MEEGELSGTVAAPAALVTKFGKRGRGSECAFLHILSPPSSLFCVQFMAEVIGEGGEEIFDIS
jgi:hypothetical protein